MSDLEKMSPALEGGTSLHLEQMTDFFDALMLRASVNRAFYLTVGLYALFVAAGVGTGLLHSDIVVRSGIFFILVMGLDVLFGLGGMLSFAHIGFFSVAAYAVAVLNASYGVNFWLAACVGLLLNALLSYVLGRICLRLSGSYFILGTLAFGLMIHSVIVVAYPITGGDAGLGGISRPAIADIALTSDLQFGALVCVLAVILFWYTLSLVHSRAGRALKAMRSDPVAAACLGIDQARLRTNLFVLSSIFASISGALYASYFGAVHPESFSLGVLVDVLLMLFLGGYGSIWGGLLGATLITLLPELNASLSAGKELFNGLLFAVIILAFPRGLAGAIEQVASYFSPTKAGSSAHFEPAVRSAFSDQAVDKRSAANLKARNLQKRFGGVQAVDDLSFEVAPGTVKGLIGPNGAGKSTTINLMTGILPPTSGSVFLGHTLLTGLRPDEIARNGVMRTFQHERLFGDLNVIENIMVGAERGIRGSFREIWSSMTGIRSWAREEHAARSAARTWLDEFGVASHAEATVETLPGGLRKLVEVARACAARPSVLLLDETAAGLNDAERMTFREIVHRLRRSGTAIVLIEHDLEMVMELSDEICVLDFGRKIADATPGDVRSNPQVISAYMGA